MDVNNLLAEHQLVIVDSLMGTGKTTAMMKVIDQFRDRRFIFVTPLLDEVDRVKNETSRKMYSPDKEPTKLDAFHTLLRQKRNIAMTHKLFLNANDETVQLIKKGGYCLVLDEELSVLQRYNDHLPEAQKKSKYISSSDVKKVLLNENWISICTDKGWRYGQVEWVATDKSDTKYSEVEHFAKLHQLYCVIGSDKEGTNASKKPKEWTLYWEFDPAVFRAFQNIFVLSYLFEGSKLNAYFHIHGFVPHFVSAKMIGERESVLIPYADDPSARKALAPLIKLYVGKHNDIGIRHDRLGRESQRALSINHLTTLSKTDAKAIVDAMYNFYKNFAKCTSQYVLWTTAKGAAREFAQEFEEALDAEERKNSKKFAKIYMQGAEHTLKADLRDAEISKFNAELRRKRQELAMLETANSKRKLTGAKRCRYVLLKQQLEDQTERTDAYYSTFLAHSSKATNAYADRTCLLYMINRMMAPGISSFFAMRGYEIEPDRWALSEMIQWIWRGAIRKGQPICLFVPSYRMRKLLLDWLGVDESYYKPQRGRPKKVKENAEC